MNSPNENFSLGLVTVELGSQLNDLVKGFPRACLTPLKQVVGVVKMADKRNCRIKGCTESEFLPVVGLFCLPIN